MAKDNKLASGSRNEEIDLEKEVSLSVNKPSLKTGDEEVDLEKAIELTGFGRFNAGHITICGLALVSMVQETFGIGFILPAAQCDLALTTSQKGYLSGVTFLGMVVSAHAWGFCADTFGRKKVLFTSVFGAWSFSFASSLIPTAGLFIGFRFLTGLFLCGTTSTVYAYLSEFLPSANRSKIMTWTCGFIAGAYLLIPGVAWLLLPVEINWNLGFVVFTSWRLYIVIMGALSFVEFVVFLYFPESPKFLMSVGKKQEALQVLRYIYALNSGNSGDDYPVKDLKFEITGSDEGSNERLHISPEISVTPRGLAKVLWRQTAPLFQKPYGWKSLHFCTLQFGIYVSSGGMYLWMPNLLNMMSSGDNLNVAKAPATICEFVAHKENLTSYSTPESTLECSNLIREEVYMSTLVVGAFYVVSYPVYGGLVSIFGKRNVLVSALLLSGIAGIGSYFARDEITLTLLLSGYVVLAGTCISVLNAAIVDAYPTYLRAMAVSMALTLGRLGSGLAGNVVGVLIEANCDFTLIGMGCITLACGLLGILLPK